MAGEMTLFGAGNPLVNSDLFKSLQDMNKKLAGGDGGGKRISIKGGKFRMMIGGEQVSVSKDDTMNIVVVNVASVSRTYYEGTYDSNNPTAPHCWSLDTRVPSPEVPAEQRMADRCADCPMNIKGSGQSGNSRACRFNQRLAITLEGKPDEVYQLQLPATSIFGETSGGHMPMQAYAKLLNAHNTPIIAVMTQMYFDENSETPKLFFKPVRPLNEEELMKAVEMRDSEDAIKAITLSVSQTDNVEPKAKSEKPSTKKNFKIDDEEKPKASSKASVKAAVEENDDDGNAEVEQPKKVEKKATAAPPPKDEDLAALVDDWDDE